MFGDMEEKRAAMNERLAAITLEAEAGDGAVIVKVNGNQQVLNVSLDKGKLDLEDTEQLEDLITIAVNRALQKAAEQAASEAQKMISDLLPPGMGDFGNLFG
jgi:DNA-binding YbaB/EbfC family protein